MKPIIWLANTHELIKTYPDDVRRQIGYNLDKIQRGLDPFDWKSMALIGAGAKEMRIHEENEYRILYVAKFQEAIYVLHSFIKKSEQTSRKDILIGRRRYTELLTMRESRR
jgi:phage-related protein